MRLTLFISILSCLILLPCWLVMNHLKPPLNFISPGTTQRAAVGFVISIIIKFIANDKLTDDGHVAAIITGTLLTAASPVFIIGIGFNHSLLRFGHRGKRRTGMDMDKLHHMKMFGMKNVILEKC